MIDFENKVVTNKISIHEHNISLLDYLVKKYNFYSVSQWKDLIFYGNIKIDDQVINKDQILKLGNNIEITFSNKNEPSVNKNFQIVYEDEDLIIINKPHNLPMHPSGKYYGNTLINLLKREYGTNDLWIANRLDRDTSGLCIICKKKEVVVNIQEQFFWNKVKKTYSLIVLGEVEEDEFTVNQPLRDINTATPNKKTIIDQFGKESKTYFEVVSKSKFSIYNGNIKYYYPYTVLKAYPREGRTHQIRVHIAHKNHPIINDKLYNTKFCILNSPMFLRCIYLKFTHPNKGEMEFNIEPLNEKLLQF